jgi:hypothetical protein
MGGQANSQLCANCGTELRAGTRFCRTCGQSVEGNDTPALPFPTVPSAGIRDRLPGPSGVTAQDEIRDAYAGGGATGADTPEPSTLHLPGGGLTPRPPSLDDTVTSAGAPAVPRWPQRPPADDQAPRYQDAADEQAGYRPAGGGPAGYDRGGYQPPGYQPPGERPPGERPPDSPAAGYPPPDYPTGHRAPAGRGSHRGRIILGLLAVIVVAGGIAAGLLIAKAHSSGHTGAGPGTSSPPAGPASSPASGSGSSPASSGTASAQQQGAQNLAKLLSQSVSDRGAINNAYNDVASCGPTLSQDQGTFQQAVTSRQALLTQLSSMPDAAALPASMISSLTQAWTASIKADQDFAAWAGDESTGCTPNGSDANLSAATVPDNQATQDKTAFVGSWNPIAQQYGLPTYSQDQL